MRAFTFQPKLVAGMVETAKRDAKEQLSMVVREITSKGLEAQAILRIGNGYEEIVSVAKEMKADLIIIGSHSYWGLGRILLGSTLELVLQYAPCPVLVVKSRRWLAWLGAQNLMQIELIRMLSRIEPQG